ncbi:hypothetical protein K439DRAFT_1513611 [Ramaria rubella]|nr:hypothetical protein K439DRAFT_1513611 [Ramaria rubella]
MLEDVDLYAVLKIPHDAHASDVKQAYHRILLSTHPDKRKSGDRDLPPLDARLLRQAYLTLFDVESRREYDASLAAREASVNSGSRPAQVVSLEEFEMKTSESGMERWTHACRCGGVYRIDEQQLEEDLHLIGCDSCSEVIWVGYDAECENADAIEKA